MNLEQVKRIAADYHNGCLSPFEAKSHTLSGQLPDNEHALAHASWMCEEIASMDDLGKAMRWLCFVQGVLWMTGRRSINDMRNDNR